MPQIMRRSGLSPAMRRQVRAFAESFYATDAGPPDPEHLDWVLDDLGQMLAHAGTRARLLFRASVFTMTYLVPLVLLGKPTTFARLNHEDRLRGLHRAESSPAGLAVFLVRALTSLVYYEHPRGRDAIRWDRSCMDRLASAVPGPAPAEEAPT